MREKNIRCAAVAVSAVSLLAAPAAMAHGQDHGHWNHQNHGHWNHQNHGDHHGTPFQRNSVVVAATSYPAAGDPLIQLGQSLPYDTTAVTNGAPQGPLAVAVAPGTYPDTFNNDGPDGSFSVATPIQLLDVKGSHTVRTISVPTDQMTTSFSSKSELALNFSTNGQDVSFSGYGVAPNTLDASNSNTPGIIDPTNQDLAGPYYRVMGNLDSDGKWSFTDTNSYSGDNERAGELLNASTGTPFFVVAGNSNNGNFSKKDIAGLTPIADTGGAQDYPLSTLPQSQQTPAGSATSNLVPLGKFTYSSADKLGKDTNFRGLTVSDNVVYYTKGSGSNGVNTVYFLDTTGKACPANGSGVPVAGAPLPIQGQSYQLCILNGFNTQPASATPSESTPQTVPDAYPFGLWFANADTVYVADEGDGVFTSDANPYDDAASELYAGLQKWTLNTQTNTWHYDYTLQSGLNLGQPYTVRDYPTGDNGTNGPWAPATDGLRNVSGKVRGDGTATIYATTSTVSGSGDLGADPNAVVKITDDLAATTLPSSESFRTVLAPRAFYRYGGVAVVPHNYGR